MTDPPYRPSPFPASGPPAPPVVEPPAKSYVGLVVVVTVLLVLLIAGGTALALALRSTVLDPAAVERDVARQFQAVEGVAVALTCAEEMEVAAGASYECTGVTADEEEVRLRITVTDEPTAAYTWTEL
jgi:hypothetical protein